MAPKKNCWEINNCDRGPDRDDGKVCPAASESAADGLNGGIQGGRICWAVAGTFCGWKIQGSFARKELTCMDCRVFKQVKEEEGDSFLLMKPVHTVPDEHD